jgi:hypothetical protein
MSKYIKAKDVLVRSREEVINELFRTGESGGTGLAQRYAPILVNLQQAIDVVDQLLEPQTSEPTFAEKMKVAKAAKASAKVVAE